MKNIKKLSREELETIRYQINDEFDRRDNVKWIDTTKTYDELVKLFNGYGYVIPIGSYFWRIKRGEYMGCYGCQVGSYIHTCHVDTTDFFVLLLNNKKHEFCVESFDEMDLEKVWKD